MEIVVGGRRCQLNDEMVLLLQHIPGSVNISDEDIN